MTELKKAVLPVVLIFFTFQCFMKYGRSFTIPNVLLNESVCSRKCKGNPEANHDVKFPPYHCSCSSSCKIYGDCCHDSEYKNIGPPSNVDFICLTVDGRGPIQVVAGCPPDKLSDFCKSAISHLPPVTNKVSNVTYANIFCAQCNGDGGNLITWNVELKCCPKSENENDESFRNPSDIFLQDNYLWSIKSDNSGKCSCNYHVHFKDYSLIDSLELRFCSNRRRISYCPYSWSKSETEKNCRSYEDPVYFGATVFRNLHCAKCNYRVLNDFQCLPPSVETLLKLQVNDTSAIYFCNKMGIDSCLEYITGSRKGRPFALADMMRGPISVKSCVPSGTKCCSGESYDYLSKRCRKVTRKGKK